MRLKFPLLLDERKLRLLHLQLILFHLELRLPHLVLGLPHVIQLALPVVSCHSLSQVASKFVFEINGGR